MFRHGMAIMRVYLRQEDNLNEENKYNNDMRV